MDPIVVLTIIAVFVIASITISIVDGIAFTPVNSMMLLMMMCCKLWWIASSAPCLWNYSIVIKRIRSPHRLVALMITPVKIIPGIRMIVSSCLWKMTLQLSPTVVDVLRITHIIRIRWRILMIQTPTIKLIVLLVPVVPSMRATMLLLTRRS